MLFETHVDRNVGWGGLMRDNVIDETGTHEAQVEERSNPGSTIIMQVHEIQLEDEDENEDDIGKSRFERIYVCFGASKKGFIAGCRPYNGVDACHFRGPYKG
ncbi:hypothetical protein ACSBR2_003618 [Camellia fascicularis]